MEVTEYLGRMFGIRMVGQHPWVRGALLTCRTRVVLAAQTIANIVKSSLGPMGLDKMLVDNIGVS